MIENGEREIRSREHKTDTSRASKEYKADAHWNTGTSK
jgi:hypothetical protein